MSSICSIADGFSILHTSPVPSPTRLRAPGDLPPVERMTSQPIDAGVFIPNARSARSFAVNGGQSQDGAREIDAFAVGGRLPRSRPARRMIAAQSRDRHANPAVVN